MDRLIPTVNFDIPGVRSMFYPADQMNVIIDNERDNTHDWFDGLFGFYGKLQFNGKGKFTFNSIGTNPTFMNSGGSCVSFTANGSLSVGQTTVEAKEAVFLGDLCGEQRIIALLDEYERLVEYAKDGGTEINDSFQNSVIEAYTNQLLDTIQNTLTNAGAVEFKDENFIEGLDEATKNRLKGLNPNVNGWMALLNSISNDGSKNITFTGNENNLLKSGDFDSNGDYVGEVRISQLVLEHKSRGSKRLKKHINGTASARGSQAVIGVSDSIYNAIVEEYENDLANPMVNSPIRVQTMTYNNVSRDVYYINNMPVIPLAVNEMDEYLKSTTHLLGIFMTKNIALGSNFVTNGGDLEVGLSIVHDKTLKISGADGFGNTKFKKNTLQVLSNPVIGVGIADPDLVSVSALVSTPKEEVATA